MKALFTFVFLAFLSLTQAFGQTPDSLFQRKFQSTTSAGVLFGVNVASLDNYNRADSRIGLLLGFAGEYRFRKLVGLAAELNYSQQGGVTPEAEYQLNYFKLPVMLTLHDNGFIVQGGLYGAVLIKGKAVYGRWTEDLTEHFTHTDMGMALGLAYDFHGNTLLGLRFSRGFDNINKGLADPKVELVNSTLQIYGGYTF